MLNVCATWWTGDGARFRYTEDHVRALRSQIPGLVVLSNEPGYRPLLEPGKYRTWHSKLEILRPENADLRPCLHVDLDTFIVGDIAPILNLDPTKLWMIREFLGTQHRAESGLFIVPKDTSPPWGKLQTQFDPTHGDGPFLRQFNPLFMPDTVDGILSYKGHKLENGYPEGTRVVCFHGNPKPPNVEGWALDFWNEHI